MQRQVDSLNAGLQPFPAKLSANPLKALEAKRNERPPLFSRKLKEAEQAVPFPIALHEVEIPVLEGSKKLFFFG